MEFWTKTSGDLQLSPSSFLWNPGTDHIFFLPSISLSNNTGIWTRWGLSRCQAPVRMMTQHLPRLAMLFRNFLFCNRMVIFGLTAWLKVFSNRLNIGQDLERGWRHPYCPREEGTCRAGVMEQPHPASQNSCSLLASAILAAKSHPIGCSLSLPSARCCFPGFCGTG